MTPDASIAALTARRAQRADLPRLLEMLADDVLGRHREAPVDDAAYGRAFEAIDRDANQMDAHRFYAGLGFQASHVGYKLALDSNQ